MTTNKKSFFWYYYNKTGGRNDPRFVIEMIELLKEWLPDYTIDNPHFSDEYYIGQEQYKQFLMDNLK
jgi:hypothetical protein